MGLQVSRGVHPEIPKEEDLRYGSAGFIKGKSAISIARNFLGRKRNFTGESFWARGYFVSTVGLDEDTVRQYIRRQEQEDQRLEQLNMRWGSQPPSGGS